MRIWGTPCEKKAKITWFFVMKTTLKNMNAEWSHQELWATMNWDILSKLQTIHILFEKRNYWDVSSSDTVREVYLCENFNYWIICIFLKFTIVNIKAILPRKKKRKKKESLLFTLLKRYHQIMNFYNFEQLTLPFFKLCKKFLGNFTNEWTEE